MNNKKIIILIILGIGAIISLYHGLRAPARSKYGRSTVKKEVPAKTAARPQGTQGITGVARRAKRTQFNTMQRSPFIPKNGGPAGLNLNGIVWQKDRHRVIINNTILAVGEKIGENTIIDIRKNGVILSNGVKEFELKLKQ